MEHFFYNDNFHSDLEDLISYLDMDEEDILNMEDDWEITCEETTLEKIFVVDKKFIVGFLMDITDRWEERFPEDSDNLFNQIEKAIEGAIDIDKLNEKLPSLYYPNGKKFKVTKTNLINWL
jgi:hypothetical protein